MEHVSRNRNRRTKIRKPPKVPIKTYRWEDIRRSRRRGGYPWTHLYKGPYTHIVDADQFTMDAIRKAKSSSEVSSWADYSGKTTPTLLQELINEPDDISAKNSRPSSVVIEEIIDDKDLEDDVQIKEFHTESAESSDNISQYLDKEERGPATSKTLPIPERAKSEETDTVQRKRKLSIESGTSGYSLSKLGVMKKLQEAKKKIKVPKISFHTKKSSPPKEVKVKKETTKKEAKKQSPVYIHIPLKPPPEEIALTEAAPLEEKENVPESPKQEETKSPFSSLERGPRVTRKPPLKINPAFKQFLHDVRQLKDKELEKMSQPKEAPAESIEEEVLDLEEQQTSDSEPVKEDPFDRLFEANTSKPRVRSKSVEPPPKRRHSIDSRKSMSKIGLMKKLKDASDKVKKTLSMENLKKKFAKKEDMVKKEETPKKPKSTAGRVEKKPVQPVYIHIPLKLPEGETDEFSHLADEAPAAQPKKEERTDSLDSTSSPISPKRDIQFIFLTPPSDDEILDDKSPDIPETPSSTTDDPVFFSTLKKLASDAVEQVSPDQKKLETVSEEMVVDVEDGLNEPPKEEQLKSALKSSEFSGQKRVSFKRKAKKPKEDESGYETITPAKEEPQEVKVAEPELDKEVLARQSLSLEEEKNYLDQKIFKETSLEEDYSKWSKNINGDHEYEPVIPPEEVMPMPDVAVVDEDTDPKLVISAVDILDKPVEEKKRAFFQIGGFKRDKSEDRSINEPPEPPKPSKFQRAFKQRTDNLKTKLHNINMPQFKKLHLPKMPNTATIHLPHINIPGARKSTKTKIVETRQYSTESNVDDSEQPKQSKFDKMFGGTFPRFKKTKKPKESDFATVPRQKTTTSVGSETSSIRIPLHSEDSMDAAEAGYEEGETLPQHRPTADVDEYERENQAINQADYLSRWQHGNFRETLEDEDEKIVGALVEQRFGRMGHYEEGESLEDKLRRDEENFIYVEEEDEFMRRNNQMVTDLDEDQIQEQPRSGYSSEGSESLHKKGRLGKLDINSDEFFVVHEIREGFQTPSNALAQMNEYDPIGSNRSLPMQMHEEPIRPEKKTIKKPKRRKTPHVSQEEIPGDEESIEDATAPSRPKRRSRRNRKRSEKGEEVVPYQETIAADDRLNFPRESLGILGDDEQDEDIDMYEQDRILEQERFHILQQRYGQDTPEPSVPPRKHRSLKSLTQSENDSILTDDRFNFQQDKTPPKPPSRRSRSHTSSLSRISLPPSQRDNDSIFTDEGYLADSQPIPSYLIENQNFKPCVEEPCVQDFRDYMGYSVVDKNKPREPPLPPPTRRRKREANKDKFSTVPRNVGLNQEKPPVRPLRNYSTLSHVQSSRQDLENKENELDSDRLKSLEDDILPALTSGDVVQKMQQRPLPAPPRPPRKPKSSRKSLQDITSQENIKEENVSTQTEPLPADFVCEEVTLEPSDTIISPSKRQFDESCVERFPNLDPRKEEPKLITPTMYSFEETVTHGALLVKPLDGAKLLPDHQLSRERLVPISREESDSEVPETFKQLKDPEVLKATKLQVADLDVDRLTVNELLASKLIVSDIDSGSLKLGDVELPPQLLERLAQNLEEKKTPIESEQVQQESVRDRLQEDDHDPPSPPPRTCFEESSPDAPPRTTRRKSSVKSEMLEPEIDDQPPPRPPEPLEGMYIPSQPPASFYALRAKEFVEQNIPTAPRRKRHHPSRSRPRSSSEDSSVAPNRPSRRRVSEPSISDLSSRLVHACASRANNALKRLIHHLIDNLVHNSDGNQDLHVIMVILLVLIAGLILLGYGEDRTVVHLHHWEYFNPPKDL